MFYRRFLAVALTLAGVCGAHAPGAWAAPSTPETLRYELTGCSGPAGTPTSLVGLKQPSEAAALHLTTGGHFIFMEAVDATTGQVLFSTPGFGNNSLSLVTCDLTHPTTQEKSIVRGLITPVR